MMPLREEGCSLGKTVKVRNLVIGEGMPKICVPITGRCEEDILAAARAVLEVPADMAEWRADWYDRAGSRDEVSVILKKIRSILGDMTAGRLIREAGASGVRVVASSHDFDRTPDKIEMTRRLFKMKELGADILKIAVMPQSRSDVASLLEVSADAAERTDRPVIAISMGKLGTISRIACEAFGSSVTFASASRASAPGQPGAAELKEMLIRLHGTI